MENGELIGLDRRRLQGINSRFNRHRDPMPYKAERRRITVDKLVETNARLSIRELDRGGPPAAGAVDFVMVDGVRVEIVRAEGGLRRRMFVCPRCGGRRWHIYLNGVACRDCLGLRYAARHHLLNQQSWRGPTRWRADGRPRKRKVAFFTHHKRRAYSQAGWSRK